MKIVAALAWYDEPVENLARCVKSLSGTADALYALDGAWPGFPHTARESPGDQEGTIRQAAHDAGIHDIIVDGLTPLAEWYSQVNKRNSLMETASEMGDWILVIDADEWIHDPRTDQTRELLATTPLDVGTVGFRNVSGSNREPSRVRRVYRAPVTVEKTHHGYRAPDGRWLHGYPDHVRLEPAVDLPLSLLHDPMGRPPERKLARRAYYEHRRRHQTERWT